MTRKIGIFSDVHGNYTALKAVYEDALALGVDDFWFLGDLFSPGPGAQDLWERTILSAIRLLASQ